MPDETSANIENLQLNDQVAAWDQADFVRVVAFVDESQMEEEKEAEFDDPSKERRLGEGNNLVSGLQVVFGEDF